MTTAATSLLGLALPVTGELAGTWGTTVNDSITSLLDTAVAGTTTLSTDGDVTLSTTTLAANQARQAILLCSGARTALRTITAPAQSKIYTIINATTGGYSVKLVGAGPTTGVTIVAGESALVAWNGSDFIKISNTAGGGTFTDLTVSNSLTLSYGTANGVLYLNGSKVATSGSALTFDGTNFASTGIITSTNVNGVRAQYPSSAGYYAQLDARDGNTYLSAVGSTAAIVFRATDGPGTTAEAMRLTSTGLGIGTPAPLSKLTVAANMASAGSEQFYITGTASTQQLRIGYNTTSNYGAIQAVQIGTAYRDLVLNADGGNVGIGTSSPDAGSGAKLTTKGIYVDTGGGDAGYGWQIVSTSSGAAPLQLIAPSITFATGANLARSTRLTLDSSGNLGLGVTPSAWGSGWRALQIGSGGPSIWTDSGRAFYTSNVYFDGTNRRYVTTNPAVELAMDGGAMAFKIAPSGTAGNAISFTQAMTLHASGGLSVGSTSDPGANNIGLAAGGKLQYSSTAYMTPEDNAAGARIVTPGVLNIATGGTTVRATLDSSGNLGLGVTPSAWATYTALQIKNGSIANYSPTQDMRISSNAYYNAGWKYISSAYGVQYLQDGSTGQHQWFTAASGTAGNAISFTTAMTLDASGRLGIGVTNPSVGLVVAFGTDGIIGNYYSSSGANSRISFSNTSLLNNNVSIGSSSDALVMYTGGSERARIDSSGNLLVGTDSAAFTGRLVTLQTTSASNVITAWNSATSGDNSLIGFFTDGGTGRGSITYNRAGGLVAYNTTSDYRAKDIIGPVLDSGSVIDSVPVYMGKMKGATQERPMFIAHETPAYAHTGEKDAVDANGNPVYQQMDASALIPVMWAEIQSLRARVTQLEAKGA